MFAVHPVPTHYRQPLVGSLEPRFRRALAIATSLGFVFLLTVWLAPEPAPVENSVEALPERLARLILDDPAPPAPPAPTTTKPKAEIEAPEVKPKAETPTPKPVEQPAPRTQRKAPRTADETKIAADRGTAGRAKAQAEVTEQLAAVTSGVDETLESLASVLPATTSGSDETPRARRRGGRVREGRGAAATGTASARTTERGSAVGGEALAARPVDLGSYGDFDLGGVSGSAEGPSTGSTLDRNGDRTANDLMNVVRRYAPGIRFCYDTALEADRSLRGKMSFRITVAADGTVAGVEVVEDTLGSADVRACALAQIESWRFGRATTASVFDAPFVFRPRG